MKWATTKITVPGQGTVSATAPVIVSASRRCDIPAFQGRQFIGNLRQGYAVVTNPFNGKPGYVSFEQTRLFVFWTKNPKPFFPVVEQLMEREINFYFQFTLNDYEREGYEKGLPVLTDRIETFQRLSRMIGSGKVIWRFDPLLLTDLISLPELLGRIERLAEELAGFTHRLVFSFADIAGYRKVDRNLQKLGVRYQEFDRKQMEEAARVLSDLGKRYNMEVSTCCEAIDLTGFGITPNRCIDNRLIVQLFPEDKALMDFVLGGFSPKEADRNYPKLRDLGQRKSCGCILAKDIGAYRECHYGCIYCYAQ